MLEFLNEYPSAPIIIVIINFLLVMYVLLPRLEKKDFSVATKFTTYIVFVLSILGFLYGIYLCATVLPGIGTYSGHSAVNTFKGNLFRFLIPIFVLGFNGFLIYGCYPMIKSFGSTKNSKKRK